MGRVGFLGYLECVKCKSYTYVYNPDDISITHHPDNDAPIANIKCSLCGEENYSPIGFDHFSNFTRRGVGMSEYGGELNFTDEDIDTWVGGDVDGEIERLSK